MSRQIEVIRAFANGESSPSRASNFRLYENGSRAYLIGGRDGREMVLAKREPIAQITIFAYRWGANRNCSLGNSGGLYQLRKVRRFFRRHYDGDATIYTLNELDDGDQPDPEEMEGIPDDF